MNLDHDRKTQILLGIACVYMQNRVYLELNEGLSKVCWFHQIDEES